MPYLYHSFINPHIDSTDTTQTRPSDWNARLKYSNSGATGPGGSDALVREVLTANRTYYVRTDGNDSNSGLTNTAAGAFLTIQKAVNVTAESIDLNGYAVTIQVGNGTYNESVNLPNCIGSIGAVTILGDNVTPGNVIVNGGGSDSFSSSEPGALWLLDGMSVDSLGSYFGAVISWQKLIFGTASNVHLQCAFGGVLAVNGDYEIAGDPAGGYHLYVFNGGIGRLVLSDYSPYTITLTGARTFSQGFVGVSAGTLEAFNFTIGGTGSATGYRFIVNENGAIQTYGSGITLFPGTISGRCYGGGTYDNSFVRETLNATRNYYVRTDGSDSNDGLTNTAAGAFLTVQYAIDTVVNFIDGGGNIVVINVGSGTFTGACDCREHTVGVRELQFIGAGEANTTINTSGAGVTAFDLWKNSYHLSGMTIISGGDAIHCTQNAFVSWDNVTFGNAVDYHIDVDTGGYAQCSGTWTVTGNAKGHLVVENAFIQFLAGASCTLTGVPAFSEAFIICNGPELEDQGCTFTGAITGPRYILAENGVLDAQVKTDEYPGSSVGLIYDFGLYRSPPESRMLVRVPLTAARDYYVRTDGSDSNNGLANTAAGAFLTIQHALNVVNNTIDPKGLPVRINVADGTYSETLTFYGPNLQTGLSLIGNTAVPANVIITGGLDVSDGIISVKGFSLRSTGFSALGAGPNSIVYYESILFDGSASTAHIWTRGGGYAECTGNYSISGSVSNHYLSTQGGIIECKSRTITLTGTPAFAAAFAESSTAAIIRNFLCTFNGGATGIRYNASMNGVIETFGGGANYFPGDVAGTTATGGQYN